MVDINFNLTIPSDQVNHLLYEVGHAGKYAWKAVFSQSSKIKLEGFLINKIPPPYRLNVKNVNLSFEKASRKKTAYVVKGQGNKSVYLFYVVIFINNGN